MPLPLRSMKARSLILLFVLWGCEPIEDCQLDPNSNSFYILFNLDSGGAVTFDSVKNNVVSDIFFDSDSTFTLVQLPLYEQLAELTYFFYTDSVDYQLTVSYDSRINLYGEDCPVSTYYFNLDVPQHSFDSVGVASSDLDRRVFENIEVFF